MKKNVVRITENELKQIVAESVGSVLRNLKDNLQFRADSAKNGAKLGVSGIKKNQKFEKDNPRWYEDESNYLTKGDYYDKHNIGSYKEKEYGIARNYFYQAGLAGASQNDVFTILNGIETFWNNVDKWLDIHESKRLYEMGYKEYMSNTGQIEEAKKSVFDKIGGAIVGAVSPYTVYHANVTGRSVKNRADDFLKKRQLIRTKYDDYMACLDRICNAILKNRNFIKQKVGIFDEECVMRRRRDIQAIFQNAYRTYSKNNTNHDNVDNFVDY